MHLLHGLAVDLRLRRGDQPVNGGGVRLHLVGSGKAIQNGADGAEVVVFVMPVAVVMLMIVVMVVVVVMLMVVVVMVLMPVAVKALLPRRQRLFVLSVDQNGDVQAREAVGLPLLRREFHAGDAEGVQLRECGSPVRQQGEQGRREHIAGGAHGAIQIQRFHWS